MKRDWKTFWHFAWVNTRYTLIAFVLVPVFTVIMNPHFSSPNYATDFIASLRFGGKMCVLIWIGFSSIYAAIYYLNPSRMTWARTSVPFKIAIGIPLMIVAMFITHISEPHAVGQRFDIQDFTAAALVGGITFLVAVYFAAYRRTQAHNLELRAESAETNLNVLKNQMQPHFLFNSLNSLAELIEMDKDQASNMTMKLSDLYREILENSKQPLSTVKSEISIINKYLELEKLRFGDRLKWSVVSPNNCEEIFIPSLALQTLVENAVKHGVAPAVGGGEIRIKIEPSRSGYSVDIENTGGTSSRSSAESGGTGLQNTRSRLQLLYGDRHGFKFENAAGWARVNFWFSGAAIE